MTTSVHEDLSFREYGLSAVTVNTNIFHTMFGILIKNIHVLNAYLRDFRENIDVLHDLNVNQLLLLMSFASLAKDNACSDTIRDILLPKVSPYFRNRKNLIFLTDAPYGSLGDISSASKLIRCFQRDHRYKEHKITWIVREPNRYIKARDLIPDNVEVIFINNWNEIRYTLRVLFNIMQRSLLIAYPSFHYLSKNDQRFLTMFGAPLISATEYDFERPSEKSEKESEEIDLEDDSAVAPVLLETGLNPRAVGVFIKSPEIVGFPFNERFFQFNIVLLLEQIICSLDILLKINKNLRLPM